MWKKLPDLTAKQVDAIGSEIRQKARFLVDESLGVAVAHVLREDGWNVRYVDEVGLQGHPDENVFAFACKEDRIILSHDTDFLNDRRFPPHRCPGVIILPGGSGPGTGLVEALADSVAIVGHFRKAFRGEKIRITEDGIWTVTGVNTERGKHKRTRYKFGRHDDVWEWEE